MIREEDLRERLTASLKENRPLRVKAGFDPTAPDLHLGHTVLLRKMKHFQDLGHTVIFLIGDMTGLIGDPTGRNTTRPPMTREEIEQNAETYKVQVSRFSILKKLKCDSTAIGFGPLTFENVIRLCSKYTVARLLERDDFTKRFKEGTPISVHELLYPLSQALTLLPWSATSRWAVPTRNSICWSDARFRGTTVNRAQIVATVPILEGLDGVEKMSKSKGNYIGITEPPKVMFRKIMKISDDLMYRYYELLTDIPMHDITALRDDIAAGVTIPWK